MKKAYSLSLSLSCLLFISSIFGQAENPSEQSFSDIIKEKQVSNDRREKESSVESPLSDKDKEIGEALRVYRETQSVESLSIIKEVLDPASDSKMIFATIRRLPLDADTYELLRSFISDSESTYRGMAVDRLKFAPAALGMNDVEVAELLEFLRDIINDPNNSDFRLLSWAEKTLQRLEETPYIGVTHQNKRNVAAAETDEETSVITLNEDQPEPPKVVEAVVTPKSEVNESAEIAPEESTNWLLWLIGALVVLGGLVVVARRKS